MIYCFFFRKYPSVHVFFVRPLQRPYVPGPTVRSFGLTPASQIDHRNDIAVNIFGLVMAVTGERFVWYLDPIGAICIALIILFSWVSNAFEQVWLLVGKSAPREFVSKLVYISMTHDPQIRKVDTVSRPSFSFFFFFFRSPRYLEERSMVV